MHFKLIIFGFFVLLSTFIHAQNKDSVLCEPKNEISFHCLPILGLMGMETSMNSMKVQLKHDFDKYTLRMGGEVHNDEQLYSTRNYNYNYSLTDTSITLHQPGHFETLAHFNIGIEKCLEYERFTMFYGMDLIAGIRNKETYYVSTTHYLTSSSDTTFNMHEEYILNSISQANQFCVGAALNVGVQYFLGPHFSLGLEAEMTFSVGSEEYTRKDFTSRTTILNSDQHMFINAGFHF
ncbi:MAG: hypothetical protein C0594_01320 [Marinilabiliales bacterium]|nr:MAG: hypothetical protein C0594_01320 [Marinilabiliales bacterium]